MRRPSILLLLTFLLTSAVPALATPNADGSPPPERTASSEAAAVRGDGSVVEAARKSRADCKDKPSPAARKRCLKQLKDKPDPLPYFCNYFCNGARARLLAEGTGLVLGTPRGDVFVADDGDNFVNGLVGST
jgi:hypothetical protein